MLSSWLSRDNRSVRCAYFCNENKLLSLINHIVIKKCNTGEKLLFLIVNRYAKKLSLTPTVLRPGLFAATS